MSLSIKSYTENEMYDLLDLVQPSDAVLEAKILFNIKKYQQSPELLQFFQNMYNYFFSEEEEEEIEGMEGQ
jgi:hypothetical protein